MYFISGYFLPNPTFNFHQFKDHLRGIKALSSRKSYMGEKLH